MQSRVVVDGIAVEGTEVEIVGLVVVVIGVVGHAVDRVSTLQDALQNAI